MAEEELTLPPEVIQERIKKLQEQLKQAEERRINYDEKYGDDYNQLLAIQPWLVNANVIDSMKLKQDTLKETQLTDLANVLRFFEGKTPTQKRNKLIRFLQIFPAYKTTDFHEMYYRLSKLQALAMCATKKGEDDSPFYKELRDTGFIF